jgi:hypothetical protein
MYNSQTYFFVFVLAQPMSPEVDVGVLQRSRASIEKLRDQMKAKDKEIQSRNSEIENVSLDVCLFHQRYPFCSY